MKTPKFRPRKTYGRQWETLNPLDQALRVATNVGMFDGVALTIEFISGFELFGHYESWGQGWRVTGKSVTVEREWLDDAVSAWISEYAKHKN